MASSRRAKRIRRRKRKSLRYFNGGKRSRCYTSIKRRFQRKDSGPSFSVNDILLSMGSRFADRN